MRIARSLFCLFVMVTAIQCTSPKKRTLKLPPVSAREPGIAGWWTFDELRWQQVTPPDQAVDSSGLRSQSQVFDAARVPGKIGDAMRFTEPRSRVRVACTKELNLGQAITIMAWIYPEEAKDESRVIVSKNDEYALRIDKPREGGRISFFVHVGSPAVTWEPRVSSQAPPPMKQWTHVAAVWDGQESRLYINGKLANRRARTGKPNPNPYPVMIGNWEYPSCHGTSFGGLIDEVRIHARALTEDEIRKRM